MNAKNNGTFSHQNENQRFAARIAELDHSAAGPTLFRSLAENLPGFVLCYDRQLRIEYASPQAQEFGSVSVSGFPGKTNREAGIPEQLCVLWDAAIQEVFRSGQPQELDFEFPAGTAVRYFRLKLVPEIGPEAETDSCLAIAAETTAARESLRLRNELSERWRAEEAIRESEERFWSMAAACPSLVWVTNAEGQNTIVNRRFRECFGAGYEQVEGDAWQRLLHPEDAAEYIGTFMRAVRDRSAYRAEGRVRRVDGEWRWIETFAEPRFSASGEFLGHVGITMDVTERKQAEERLRASEERFRSLFENMQEGFAYCRMIREPGQPDDYVHLAVNQAFETLTGLKDAVGRKISEVIPGIQTANPELFEVYGRVASTGRPETFETWVPALDRWFSVSAYRPKEEHFVAIFSNVTERKRSEEALRDTNRRLQFAVAAGHLGIWEWDIEADVTVWNDKMFELYGVSRDGFRPSRLAWLTSLHPDDRAMAIETALATMNGQRGYSQEYRVVTPDGTVKYIKADALLVRDANGKPTQMVGLNQDITESKLAIARLDESETRFRQVVEGAPSGIFVQTDGYFRYLNPAALALYGAETSAQLIGQPFMERVHPDCREMVAERVRTLREEGQNPPLLELQHLRLDGSVFDVQVTAAPFTFGASESSVCFLRDISDRKRAERERSQIEEQFRHAQKMESIGRMAGGVSHDFNNLLTVINGYTDLLSRALKEGDPLRDWVAEIGKAGEKAAGLTRQLLAFSRKQILAPKPLDLNSTVVENRDMLHRLLGEDIDLVTDLAPDLGQVMADPGQIHQVLMNLVVNAQDAMSGGGRLTIQTANIDAGQDEAATHCGIVPGQYVLLAVSDTGSGIEKAIQDRIFDPFFTTKGEGEGTGLGLSTVYGIVQQCGGSISLSSEMGKGTTFKIHLPRFTAAISASQSVDPGRSNLRGMETVLVVEDQEPVRKLVVRTLKNCGYRVLEADQGAAALLLAESESGPIHLLITDVVMPHMTGRELAERFLLLRPEAKVIYMSGYETDVLARRGALNSEAQYIAKPFAQGALAAKVRATLGPPPSAARILVVEDEVSVRTLFRKLLEDSGYEVVTVAKGCQAVEMLRTREFQMVLTDLMPAGAEGIDIIQAIRREQPQLKIIAVSGALGGALRRAPEEPGVDARLIKPVSADTLLTTVRSVLA